MYYEEEERAEESDPFEVFGELADANEDCAAATQPHVVERKAPAKVRTGFSWAGFAGGLAALAWIAAAIGAPLSYFGIDAIIAMAPAMQAGLVALGLGPALLFWVAASAAGEALKARRLAVELTRMAREARLPAEAGEASARRLSETVKLEIESMNDAVAAALDRLAELEHSAQRNAALFNQAVSGSRENTEAMSQTLRQERDALVDLNSVMRGETEVMAHSVGRQVRLLREASKLVKSEMSAAEDALDQHLAAFAASAATLGHNTAAFHQAADGAHAAASALGGQVVGMLDGLSEATRLTDAARQSAEQAVHAANETAHAVRETTRGAVTEAKRAAQLVRAETLALHDAAEETLAKLQAAARAARDASDESQAAADRHASSIEKRLSALASTANARKPAPPRQAERAERPIESIVANDSAAMEVNSLHAAAGAAASRWAQPRASQVRVEADPRRGFKGLTGWNGFQPQNQVRAEFPRKAANESASAYDLVDFAAARRSPDATLKDEAVDLVTRAGVDLGDVLAAHDLERIAQSSRHGAAARRSAVADAAPGAVSRIARHVKRSNSAHVIAAQFRARPDLAKSESKGEGSELVRAYLLIDAALA